MKVYHLGCSTFICKTLVLKKGCYIDKWNPFFEKDSGTDSFPYLQTVLRGTIIQLLFWYKFYKICPYLLTFGVWTNNGSGWK